VVPGAEGDEDVLLLDPGLIAGHLDVEVVVEGKGDGLADAERDRALGGRRLALGVVVAAGQQDGEKRERHDVLRLSGSFRLGIAAYIIGSGEREFTGHGRSFSRVLA
jgi:hypothetical protein